MQSKRLGLPTITTVLIGALLVGVPPAGIALAQTQAAPSQPTLSGAATARIAELRKQVGPLRNQGDYAAALKIAEEILAIRAAEQAADWWQVADTRRMVEMIRAYAQLPADQQASLAEADRLQAELGKYFTSGEYSAAADVVRRQLELRRPILGGTHIEVGNSLNNLALMLYEQGDYGAAEPMYAEARAVLEPIVGRRHPSMAQVLNNLALLRYMRGDYAAALPLYEEALATREALLAENDPNVGQSLNGYAACLEGMEEYERSHAVYERSLALRKRVLEPDHEDIAKSMNNLGGILMKMGRPAEAEPLFSEALAMRRRRLGDDHPDVAWSLTTLGDLQNGRGDHAAAEKSYLEALGIREKALGTRHTYYAQSLSALASVEAAQGRGKQAVAHFREAVGTLETQRTSVLGDERARASYSGRLGLSALGCEVAALLVEQGHPEEALTMLERTRGRALLDLLARSDRDLAAQARASGDAALGAKLDEAVAGENAAQNALAEAESALAQAGQQGDLEAAARQSLIVERTASLAKRRQEAADTEAAVITLLRSVFPDARPLDALQIRAGLHEGEVALSYAWSDTRVVLITIPRKGEGSLDAAVLATGPEAVKALGDQAAAARAWLVGETTGGASPLAALGAALVPDVMRPQVGAAKRLVILPDGPLNDIPFEPLLVDVGPPRPMAYAASGTAYINRLEAQASQPAERATVRAVVLADAVFSRGRPEPAGAPPSTEAHSAGQIAAIDQVRLFGGSLSPLPATRAEAAHIQRSIVQAGGVATLLTGEGATLEALTGASGGADYLHLATHGLMGSAERPYDACLALTQPREPNPHDVGFLRLEDLTRSWRGRLSACELVVLSACDTQSGVKRGDSVMALPWGFFYAGAPTVIASLWKVDDTATSLLMGRLYENLLGSFDESRTVGGQEYQARIPKAEALLEAKMWLRTLTAPQIDALRLEAKLATSGGTRGGPRDRTIVPGAGGASEHPYDHPYYWGAFVLIGSPR